MKYKPDIHKAMENTKKWWHRENIGRCAITVTAPKKQTAALKKPAMPKNAHDKWTDFEYIKSNVDYNLQRTFFGGEAMPVWSCGYPGHDSIPAFLGCDVLLDEETGWWKPIIGDGELNSYDIESLVIDSSNKWWRHSQKYHAFANECSDKNSMPSVPAMGGTGDTLAALRGTERLLFDLVEQPETVKKFEEHLMTQWIAVYSHYYEMHKAQNFGGSCNFFRCWAPGTFYIPSNDFSYMISTDMYERIFLDGLTRQIDFLDFSIYHVDGVEAFRHVDLLCGIKKLNALQILPGAGKPSPLYYMDILKKVQGCGKNLHISIPPHEVKTALDNLSSKGLMIDTFCENEEDARDLIDCAVKWSKFY